MDVSNQGLKHLGSFDKTDGLYPRDLSITVSTKKISSCENPK